MPAIAVPIANGETHPAPIEIKAEGDGRGRECQDHDRVAAGAKAAWWNFAQAHLGAEPMLFAHKADEQKAYPDRGNGKEILTQTHRGKAHNEAEHTRDHEAC